MSEMTSFVLAELCENQLSVSLLCVCVCGNVCVCVR